MLYFTSDSHFCDQNTLINDNRPFKSVKQMDRFLLKTWNKQTKKEDTIFVLGDFINCDGPDDLSFKKSIAYVSKLKAKVILVCGNNEDRAIKYHFQNIFELFKNFCLEKGFFDVVRECDVVVENTKFHLVHKPKNCVKDNLNLFGHVHRSTGLYKPFGFNVGCDLNHFRLYSQNDIKHLLDMKKKYWDVNKNLAIWEIDNNEKN